LKVNWFFSICSITIIVAVALPQTSSAATSLTGSTGLVNIPTAYIISDGKIAFGVGYTDRNYSLLGPKYAQAAYYATAGYLPFLEVSLRVTVFPGRIGPGKYGSAKDRMASIKLKLLNESRYLPTVLIGSHDILTTYSYNDMHFGSEYVVLSKTYHLPFVDSLGVHLGYATKQIKKAANYSMVGTFAGVEIKLCRFLVAMGEYDTKKYNAGLRVTPFGDKISIDIDALDMRRVSGGVSFSFGL